MNYYPYYHIIPTRPSLFGIFRGLNFSSILSGTQKALNLANQAIPLIKQVSPMFKNAKTMLRVVNEFRKTDNQVTNNNQVKNNYQTKNDYQNNEKVSYNTKKEESIKENNTAQIGGPTFFI